jgi:hypothetical protein
MTPMRYEYGAWPRWRVDKNVRYQLKGLFHVKTPSAETTAHFTRMGNYVKRFAHTDHVSPEAVRTLSVAAVGDIMWIGKDAAHSMSPQVKQILDRCDVRLANLETPIDPSQPVPGFTYDLFNSAADLLDPWTDLGRPTIFSICNNHGLDQGREGVTNTRKAVTSRDHAYCVGGLNEEDAFVQLRSADVTLTVTGMTFGSNRYSGTVAGIPQVRLGDPHREPDWVGLQQWIDRCKQGDPDLVVIIAHWGFEYEYWPESLQREHAYKLIAMGVDLIVGSSPHVLQPIDIVSVNSWDPDCPVQIPANGGKRQGVIAYSLGNFVTRMMLPACRTAAVLEIRYSWGQLGERVLQSLRAYPTIATRNNGVATTRTLSEYEAANGVSPKFRHHVSRAFWCTCQS